MFTTENLEPTDEILGSVPLQVNKEMNQELTREISDEEVKSTTFHLGGTRAPGPDGFPGLFYLMNWHIAGLDIITAVKIFFRTGIHPNSLNQIIIVLIPKVPNLTRPT